MIRLAASLLILGLAACAAAPAPAEARCDVTIKFGSYGMGVDRTLADRVTAAVKADREVARSERRPWGREGEYDVCLTAKPGSDVKAMYERYRAMLPARDLQAPTSIQGPGELRFETIGPM